MVNVYFYPPDWINAAWNECDEPSGSVTQTFLTIWNVHCSWKFFATVKIGETLRTKSYLLLSHLFWLVHTSDTTTFLNCFTVVYGSPTFLHAMMDIKTRLRINKENFHLDRWFEGEWNVTEVCSTGFYIEHT